MRILLISILTLLCSSAFADFSGYWTGAGTLKDPDAKSRSCSEVSYKVRESKLTLMLEYGYVKCDDFEYTYQLKVFDIYCNHLVFNGQTVGTLSGSEADLEYVDHGTRVAIQFALTAVGAHYTESWFDAHDKELWGLSADLHK
jgi:hypothetical protein